MSPRSIVLISILVSCCLLCAGVRAQVITEFSAGISANANIQGIAAGSDGNLWFTEPGTNSIGRITPAGVVTEFSAGMTANAAPIGIALGSDGALWFVEQSANKIGRIDPLTGTITEFGAGMTAGAFPRGIAAGPDGNLWFTEEFGHRIGQINPTTGVIAEFSTGLSASAHPFGITAALDGNLWFTDNFLSKIDQITPAGAITEFALTGDANTHHPRGITLGPDANLWFTGDNAIVQVTTAAAQTEFSFGAVGLGPVDIAKGPDGNLWFTEGTANKIGRITTSGVVTHFGSGISALAGLQNITAGPDGNLWFTENNTNAIGRITTTGGLPPVVLSIVSHKVHAVSGPFDLPLTFTTPPTINHAPTTEPRVGPTHQIVFTFDKPLNAATATVTEGTATPSSSIVGSTVVVDLTAVTDHQYVTVSLTSVGSADGGTGGVGEARVGFLTGDVNANRLVAVTDLVVVNNQLGKPLTAANFVSDVNLSGIITVLDKVVVNNNLGHFLPAP